MRTNWKRKYEQTWRELQEAMRKYMDAEARIQHLPKIIEKEVLPPWLGPFFGLVIILCIGIGSEFHQQLKDLETPILQPYVVYVYKFFPSRYEDKCRRAWKALEHHHSGVNNGKAFAILNEP